MNYIRIANDGEIDINALTLLGASSKAGDESKIGFFGSGNKYALATFLRNGVGVRIFSGSEEFAVELEAVDFRGQNFQRIVINGIQTSLTTRTGPEWELWMAAREFICNAIDEGGESWEEVDEIEAPESGRTFIYLTLTEQLAEVFNDIESVTILAAEPIATVKTSRGVVKIYDRQNGRAYRKGICCSTRHKESLFSYSFAEIDINESRVVGSEWQMFQQITSALSGTSNTVIVKRFVNALIAQDIAEELLEGRVLTGDWWEPCYCTSQLSSTWRDEFIERGQVVCPKAYTTFMPAEDVLTYLILPDGFYEKLINDWPEIPHVGEGNTEFADAVPDAVLSGIVTTALKEIKALGLDGGKEVNVRWVNFVNDQDVMRVHDKEGCTVLVSVKFFPEVDYAAGILEELTHIITGAGDGSRALQTHLLKSWLAAERRAAKDATFVSLITSAVAMMSES